MQKLTILGLEIVLIWFILLTFTLLEICRTPDKVQSEHA